jgi:hypothetical protein
LRQRRRRLVVFEEVVVGLVRDLMGGSGLVRLGMAVDGCGCFFLFFSFLSILGRCVIEGGRWVGGLEEVTYG